jgi:hypothetical protein
LIIRLCKEGRTISGLFAGKRLLDVDILGLDLAHQVDCDDLLNLVSVADLALDKSH